MYYKHTMGSNEEVDIIDDTKSVMKDNGYNDEVADTTIESIDQHFDNHSIDEDTHTGYDTEEDIIKRDQPVTRGNFIQNKDNHNDSNDTEEDKTSISEDDNDTEETEEEEKEEEEEEEYDDDDEDDEDEDEEPPLLKYKRLTKLPPRFFNKDPVSTCFIHEKLLFFATHSGIVLICKPDFTPVKIFKAHTASILSIDYDGEHFATCSMDGTIIIGLIHDDIVNDSEMIKYDFKRPIHAVALNKPYSKTKSFFCGGTSGNLIHCSKNWLGQRVDNILDEGGECVTMIKSENDLLIWCNNKGITVGQVSSKHELLHIKVPIGMNRPELYWPKIQFVDTDRILIGWVDHVWYLKIFNETKGNGNEVNGRVSRSNTTNVISTAASSFRLHYDEKKVEVIYHEKLSDCLIAGISEFNNNDLMILNYLPKVGKSQYFPPELKVVDGVTFDELSVDELVLKRYQGLGLNDYQLLEYSSNNDKAEKYWFLISANDAIIVEEFSLYDKLTWFLSKGRYLDAWNLSGLWLDKFEKMKIGKQQIKIYINNKEWENASNFVSQVLAIDNYDNFDSDIERIRYIETVVEEWNSILQIFNENGQLFKYADMIPIHRFDYVDKQINEDYYELILHQFLRNKEYKKLIHYLEIWDHELFDLQDIQLHINEILNEYDDDDTDENVILLRKSYITNSLELDEPQNCVKQLMILKDSKLMEFLDEYHLIRQYMPLLPQIILIGVDSKYLEDVDFDKLKETSLYTNINILVENINEILAKDVIELFKKNNLEIVNYIYLKELGKLDKILIRDFEDEMISMYAKFNRKELREFLKQHKKYSIDEAIKVCEKYECNEELVYLLSKIGENKKALKLIIDKMEDPSKAITFVQSINEKELWDYLLDYSMDKSSFIKELLENVGELVDPIPVVSRIPTGVKIEGLQKSIVSITHNMDLDKEIYDIIMRIISNEYMDKSEKLRTIRMKGLIMDESELEIMRKDIDNYYLKIQDNDISKEEDIIGEKWQGDNDNKIAHKTFLKFKLGSLQRNNNIK